MARLKITDLPPAIQEKIRKQYADEAKLKNNKSASGGKKDEKDRKIQKSIKTDQQAGGSQSPYADLLGARLDAVFPGRMTREFRPIDHRRFRIDFAFTNEKVAIEFDGYRYHGLSKAGFKGGLQRQNILVEHGWRVLRYTLTDVRDNLETIINSVRAALEAS